MSKIEWNKVTWYSKLLAVFVFLGTFYIAFNLGREDQALKDEYAQIQSLTSTLAAMNGPVINGVTFSCATGKTVRDIFHQNNVELGLSDGRHLVLPHAISADGARYANTAETFIFWTRGQGAFIDEGASTTAQTQTYKDCIINQ